MLSELVIIYYKAMKYRKNECLGTNTRRYVLSAFNVNPNQGKKNVIDREHFKFPQVHQQQHRGLDRHPQMIEKRLALQPPMPRSTSSCPCNLNIIRGFLELPPSVASCRACASTNPSLQTVFLAILASKVAFRKKHASS
ncbi:hypothetical protein M413DRAFT_82874 [Hebeloma cylindrosporum]|uniref:Uncharacterized protein n=1 Tax=Hebeloma cylindrosporum TaxID=76867 RepID=A0A0C3CJ02_HEBCY|nr:hypothetical protein M413DRAFT_82874 [Hebeloma cylindrosporum h7]